MSIQSLVDEIKHEFFTTKLSVGAIVEHPEHGKVKITDGYFWDPVYGRLSNWWTWRKVGRNGRLGKTYSGYGWM